MQNEKIIELQGIHASSCYHPDYVPNENENWQAIIDHRTRFLQDITWPAKASLVRDTTTDAGLPIIRLGKYLFALSHFKNTLLTEAAHKLDL